MLVGGCATTTPPNGPAPPRATTAADLAPTVILVGLDGFRWDYLERVPTPALDRLAAGGAKAGALVPIFPTKTFPNHYSIATGLYAEHHGVVANNMWDRERDAWFSMSDRAAVGDGRWWSGEPIWTTAEKAGRLSAPIFWPGSEADVGGLRPRYWKPFDDAVTDEQRVDEALAWLDLPVADRPAFISLYISELDEIGHRFGPESREVDEALVRVDRAIGRLVAGLEARRLLANVTIIVVSDHGMAASPEGQRIFLDDFVPLSEVTVVDWSPVLQASSTTGNDEALFQALAGKHPRLTVYRRGDLPDRMHFKAHPRIPGVIAVADEGWSIGRRPRADDDSGWSARGMHGYDNVVPSMHGIFIAHGPAVRPGARIATLNVVDVYELMAAALEIVPAPNDGDFDAVAAIMQPAVAEAARTRRAKRLPSDSLQPVRSSLQPPVSVGFECSHCPRHERHGKPHEVAWGVPSPQWPSASSGDIPGTAAISPFARHGLIHRWRRSKGGTAVAPYLVNRALVGPPMQPLYRTQEETQMADDIRKDETHPVGTSVGAGAGAVAGLATGSVIGGPVGGVVGAAVGAVAGGLAGQGIAAAIDPAVEDGYWRDNYTSRPYYQSGRSYDDYRDAYRYGWESRSRYNDRNWDDVENDLEHGWEKAKANSRLAWADAKHATKDAWHRVERAIPGDADRDGR